MKKSSLYLMTLFVCLFLSACGGTEKAEISETETVNLGNEFENQSDSTERSDTQEAILDSMDGRVLIRSLAQYFVTNDGFIYAKGTNEYGQLGNGKRIDSDEWSLVKGLSDVKGVFAASDFCSSTDDDDLSHAYCYALTKNGDLYKWGANILTPERVELPFKITEMHSAEYCCWFRDENGRGYVMPEHEDLLYAFPFNSLSKNDYIVGNYVVLSNKTYYLYYKGNFTPEEGFLQNTDFESLYHLVPVNTLGHQINFASSVHLTTNIGSVLTVIDEEDEEENDDTYYYTYYDDIPDKLECKDLGGTDIIKAYYVNSTEYCLFNTGELDCIGNNEYGQLGDGTTLDYDEDWLTCEGYAFKDFYTADGETASALDFNNNVWVWGKGFGKTPEIIISSEMFAGEVW